MLLISFAARTHSWGEPTAASASPAEVRLVSGKVLSGRVNGRIEGQGQKFMRVETDFGEIMVPASAVRSHLAPPLDTDGAYFGAQVRVVRIQGNVERRGPGGTEWFKVSWTDTYGADIINVPNAILRPGDRIRTDVGSELDLQLHTHIWLRVLPESEIELPAHPTPRKSLSLLRGRTLHDIRARLLRSVFYIQAGSTLLGVRGTVLQANVTPDSVEVGVAEGVVEIGANTRVSADERYLVTSMSQGELEPWPGGDLLASTRTAPRLPVLDAVLIPRGTYELGGPSASGAEAPPLRSAFGRWFSVLQEDFLIDRREVTAAEFIAFQQARKSSFAPLQTAGGQPAMPVSHTDARAFAAWAGRRLPTHVQWEIAARGTTPRTHVFPWGNAWGKEYEGLPIGTLVPDENGKVNQWAPPEILPTADAPTLDQSPWGVRSLVSSVPEWVREPAGRSIVDSHLADWFEAAYADDVSRGDGCVRGWGGSTRYWEAKSVTRPLFGLRCVVELD